MSHVVIIFIMLHITPPLLAAELELQLSNNKSTFIHIYSHSYSFYNSETALHAHHSHNFSSFLFYLSLNFMLLSLKFFVQFWVKFFFKFCESLTTYSRTADFMLSFLVILLSTVKMNMILVY